MAKSPFLKSVIFWVSFYALHEYSGRDPYNNRQKFPSYAILKQKIILDTWNYGLDSDKLSKDWGHFTMAFRQEMKSLVKWW